MGFKFLYLEEYLVLQLIWSHLKCGLNLVLDCPQNGLRMSNGVHLVSWMTWFLSSTWLWTLLLAETQRLDALIVWLAFLNGWHVWILNSSLLESRVLAFERSYALCVFIESLVGVSLFWLGLCIVIQFSNHLLFVCNWPYSGPSHISSAIRSRHRASLYLIEILISLFDILLFDLLINHLGIAVLSYVPQVFAHSFLWRFWKVSNI